MLWSYAPAGGAIDVFPNLFEMARVKGTLWEQHWKFLPCHYMNARVLIICFSNKRYLL